MFTSTIPFILALLILQCFLSAGKSSTASATSTTTITTIVTDSPSSSTNSRTPNKSPSVADVSTTTTSVGGINENQTTTTDISTDTFDTRTYDAGPSQSGETTKVTTLTTTKTKATTTPRGDEFTVDTDLEPVLLHLEVTADPNVSSADWSDKHSADYIKTSHAIEDALWNAFQNIPGFQGVTTTLLSYEEGEIICKFDLAITVNTIPNLNDSIDDVASNLLNTTVYSCVNDKKIPIQLQINTSSISETIITVINLVENDYCSLFRDNICPPGYFCTSSKTKVSCKSFCKHDTSKPCENGGSCYYDIVNKDTKCSCVDDDSYAYSGDTCQIKAEKLALDSEAIIGIAAGAGGFIILVLLVIILCLVLRIKRNKKSNDRECISRGARNDTGPVAVNNEYIVSQTHDDQHQPISSHPYSMLTRLPFDYTDAGSEGGRSTYNYIDVDKKFEIRRPKVASGRFH